MARSTTTFVKSQLKAAELFLNRYKFRKTDLRLNLMRIFLESKSPLSQSDIIQELETRAKAGSVDRVSVYRNLMQLKSVGLVHEVENNQYVSCNHECQDHPHVLLFCQSCFQHREIQDHKRIASLMQALAPLEFFSRRGPLLMKGICQGCVSSQSL